MKLLCKRNFYHLVRHRWISGNSLAKKVIFHRITQVAVLRLHGFTLSIRFVRQANATSLLLAVVFFFAQFKDERADLNSLVVVWLSEKSTVRFAVIVIGTNDEYNFPLKTPTATKVHCSPCGA